MKTKTLIVVTACNIALLAATITVGSINSPVCEEAVETSSVFITESDVSTDVSTDVSMDETSSVAISKVYYPMSDDDIKEFATLVALEGSIESYECQCAIASVVLNRMTTGDLTLQEVIYAENQFEPADKIPESTYTESTLRAVKHVITYGPTLPEYVTFFRADYYFDWVEPYTNIDHTYFSYDKNLQERLICDEV